MAVVPSSFIRNKPVDFVAEIFSCIGAPLTVGKLRLPPPAAGSFALLEMIDSEFFRDPLRASFEETARALAVFSLGRAAVGPVRAFVEDRPEELEEAGRAAARAAGRKLAPRYGEIVAFLLEAPFTGFEMLPGGERSATPFLFDGPVLGNLAFLGSRAGSLTPDRALWDVPLALLGHLAAAHAKAEGVQGVGRPKDPEDIRLQLALARERDEKGEAQPWQK